jgi:hypothetical protein
VKRDMELVMENATFSGAIEEEKQEQKRFQKSTRKVEKALGWRTFEK